MLDEPATLFERGGAIARRLGQAYEPRPQQSEMAAAIASATKDRSVLLVEAPTGVGKSFAYLAPMFLRAIEHDERVVIATNTIALQEQLQSKDAPVIREALGTDDLRIVLVKGRANYLSIRRLQLASERKSLLFADKPSLDSLHIIEDWAYSTEEGTLSSLPTLPSPGVWDRAQSDSGNCMGKRCPTYSSCFFQRARRDMEQANVLICNHALFFSDLSLRKKGVGFLPKYQHVVLDEAHAVEQVASEHFGISLTEARVMHLLSILVHRRGQKGYLPNLSIKPDHAETLDRTIHRAMRARDTAAAFFDTLLHASKLAGTHTSQTARISKPDLIENTLSPVFSELATAMRRLREHTEKDEDRYELSAYAERATAIAADTKSLLEQSEQGHAYWIESRAGASHPARRRVRFACSPIDVAPTLKDALFTGKATVILTSATLTTAEKSFDHNLARLGCPDAKTLALGSPFFLADQMEIFIEDDMPEPSAPDYLETLADRALHHIKQTDGGAFLLFTSISAMRRAATRLRPQLQQLGLGVSVQNEDGPRNEVLAAFTAGEHNVLLGVASFWQGVDVPGRTLRNVIITRLPFEPPDRPLTEARHELIRSRDGDPFMDDTVPNAVIRFKQGIGRLIRSDRDSGRIVILDTRIARRRYGSAFLRALPAGAPITYASQSRTADSFDFS